MNEALSPEALKQLFTEARSHRAWTTKPVTDDQIKSLYELLKWAPTSMSSSPGRFLFIKSAEEKEKLVPAMMGSNPQQVKDAPVVVVIAQDEKFYDHLPILFPHYDAKSMFESNKAMSDVTAFRNSSLQGAYLILAARALGLDLNAMSGFDNAKVDEAFFRGTSWKSNFIATLGYADHSKAFPRGPRLSFDQVAKIV